MVTDAVTRRDELRQRSMVLALLAAIIVVDQTTKWWAWRHAPGAIINYGGDALVPTTVGSWYADPVSGAVLDLLDFGLLSVALSVLVRRRRPAMVFVPATLLIGGWGSNLLDRLGMHYWTAPGSVRGAVDFIHIGHYYYNNADFFIIGGTPLFLLAVGYLGWRGVRRPAATGSVTAHRRTRLWPRMAAFATAVSLIAVVGIGAAHDRGVTAQGDAHVAAETGSVPEGSTTSP
jgi:lipoprotein signal peptidase